LLDRLGTGTGVGDGGLISWSMSPEPDPYGVWHSSQIPDPQKRTAGLNVAGFSSPEFDKAIDAARTPAAASGCDQPARSQQYETINKLLNTQQPYLFAFIPDAVLVAPVTLRGLRPSTFGLYADVQRWWFQK
jgi:peptide/nickel transport system substrate-binding protein